jgi:hypothetical protein
MALCRLSQGKQKISREAWKAYLHTHNIGFSEDELRYFFRVNHLGEETSLAEFLEAMIPYNADVVREFKAKYLDALELREMGPEVEFIFAELMNNWIKFLRSLMQIRSELGRRVTRRQIEHLVKEDLVLYSKPREARKFHESFQERSFRPTFHELRKFLELWVSSKELLHEFCLLNVKRHIKCDNPFQKIIYTKTKSKERSLSTSRSLSRPKSVTESHVNKNKGTKEVLNSSSRGGSQNYQ